MQDWPERERYTAEDLLQIIRILRDRENGCPWDKVQTHASIRKNFLEETCEALEAIDADDAAMMREELGDVLMQVAFHTVIEEERGRFDFEQVCREVCEKLVFRHPNIFASSAAENAGINSWDALKNKEKGRTTLADELNTVPATLPALMYAQKMQKRAARKGAFAQTAEDAADVLDELIDRYGDPPPSVSDLVNVSLVRVQASAVGVTEVTQKKDTLTLQLESLELPMIRGLLVAFNGRVVTGAGAKPYLSVTLQKEEKPLELLQSILRAMQDILKD